MLCALNLASLNRRSENVGVEAVVISELKFRDVQRHVFGAHLVEAANDTALEDAPKALNEVGVDRADNVLLAIVINRTVVVAQGPMTTRQLALYVMKAKGFDQGDKVLAKSIGLRLIHALRMQSQRGNVHRIGKNKAALIWELPPVKALI